MFNNFFYVYFFLCVMGMKELYFIVNPFINVYLIKLFFYNAEKHNKIILLMNTKYNNQQLLNYDDVMEVCGESNEIVESDETKMALLDGESETQNFDNIVLES